MGVVLIIVIIMFSLSLLLYFTQSRLLYFPMKEIGGTPEDAGLAYETVKFKTGDGVNLSGWYVPADSALLTVLFCHGNGGNISTLLATIKQLHRIGLNILVFDYRGYGDSEGNPDEEGTYLDVEAAREYLVRERGVTDSRLVLVGRSLGGAVASWLAAKHPPRALVLESTFTSLVDLASEIYPYLPVRTLLRFEYHTLGRVKNIRSPLLVIHSPTDEVIPYHHGERLFEHANEPKEFMEIIGGHNDGFQISAVQYEEGLKAFLKLHAGL